MADTTTENAVDNPARTRIEVGNEDPDPGLCSSSATARYKMEFIVGYPLCLSQTKIDGYASYFSRASRE